MGSLGTEESREEDEGPRHLVTIRSRFAVGVHEVTFAQWDACALAGGCADHWPADQGWGRGTRPVINVNWEDAQAYVEWLSGTTGEQYRLLSEAEWEYVARAGTTTARYWGESEAGQCRYENGADSFAPCPDTYEHTAPVGSFEPNAFGLYDMLGNVSEWTADCVTDDYAGHPTNGSPSYAGDCSERVLRGGSWEDSPGLLRSANRDGFWADNRYFDDGFRVARVLRAGEELHTKGPNSHGRLPPSVLDLTGTTGKQTELASLHFTLLPSSGPTHDEAKWHIRCGINR